MAEEIQEAVQIIRVSYDGIEIAMKICGGALEQIKKQLDFLIAVMEREKVMGKTDMRKLLMKGGDLQVFQFPIEDTKTVEKMAKKYGILYSILPDINKEDGMGEIIFHSEAVPRVNMMIQKLKSGRIGDLDDYLKNGEGKSPPSPEGPGKEAGGPSAGERTEETFAELVERAGSFAAGKRNVSMEEMRETLGSGKEQAEAAVWELLRIGVLSKEEGGQYKVLMDQGEFAERMEGYKELSRRVQAAAAAKAPDHDDIIITKKLIVEENGHAAKTRVPGTWGENARYIWISKDRMMEAGDGKAILTFLERDRDYKMYSADNKVTGTIKGKDLYEGYYDKVDAEVRKRYEKALEKAKEQENGRSGREKKPAPEKESMPRKTPQRKKEPVPKKGHVPQKGRRL